MSNNVVVSGTGGAENADSVQGQLNKYVGEISEGHTSSALEFWRSRRSVYSFLAPIAEDLVSAPASQAFVERIFSLCGLLTAGRRNRMKRSLEMRVCPKLNSSLIENVGN